MRLRVENWLEYDYVLDRIAKAMFEAQPVFVEREGCDTVTSLELAAHHNRYELGKAVAECFGCERLTNVEMAKKDAVAIASMDALSEYLNDWFVKRINGVLRKQRSRKAKDYGDEEVTITLRREVAQALRDARGERETSDFVAELLKAYGTSSN